MQLAGQRAMVVDDDVLVREALRLFLEDQGAEVHEARDGRDALSKLRSGTDVGLLVTDLVMPEIEGITLIRSVRREFPRTKILAMSGGGLVKGDEYLDAAKRLGADGTLAKPFDMRRFLRTIDAL